MKTSLSTGLLFSTFFLIVIVMTGPTVIFSEDQKMFEETYVLPPEEIQDILTRERHIDVLNSLGPDKEHFIIPIEAQFSSLNLMAQKTYRLGMLELCPDVNREWRLSTSGVTGLKIYSLKEKKAWRIQIPEDIFISDMTWSPTGKKIAFLAHLQDRSEVWTADVLSGKTRSLGNFPVLATLTGTRRWGRSASSASRMLQWTSDGSIITLLVPEDRGPEPLKKTIPETPIIRHTREKASPTPTYPFLLRTPHDKDLFQYYTTSQIAVLTPGKPPKNIGEPAMYMSISLSPDGKYILSEKLVKPFSYIVSYTSFPRELQVMDLSGKILSTIRKVPLQETVAGSGNQGASEDLPRNVTWRPDGKGLSFLLREKKPEKDQNTENGEERSDQLMLLAPPFNMDNAMALITSKKRFSQVSYSLEGRFIFALMNGRGEDCQTGQDLAAFDLSKKPPRKYILLKKMETKDPVKLPGDILTQATGNGIVFTLLSADQSSVYLQGRGYQENFKPLPFIDSIKITTGKTTRLFQGSPDFFEQPLAYPDRNMQTLVISRESKTLFPDSYLWEKGGKITKLTQNKNPFPEFSECKRIDFEFIRRDGLKIQSQIALPPDYTQGNRVPAIFWTYPREYSSPEDYKHAAIRSRNHNSFSQLNYRNASDIWLSQGYAVVVPDIPIIGKGNTFNNNYIAHLVDSMYAAIRKIDEMEFVDVDQLGHGGHSYGAFATANILARTPFFKAGIAGDGAYNRTLTPMSFQRERRFIWEAQDVYLEMSPFFQADHIDTPLLMYHGAADNNTGTFLIQSERLIQALTGLGKTAALYIYPFESHGPRCLETYMDMWARWLLWFDTYVKSIHQGQGVE